MSFGIETPCYYSKPRFIRVKIPGTFPIQYRTLAKPRQGDLMALCESPAIVTKRVQPTRDGVPLVSQPPQTRHLCLAHAGRTDD